MPLLSKLPPPGVEEKSCLEDLHEPTQVVKTQPATKVDEKDSGYEDFDEKDHCLDSDMEGSVMERPRPKKKSVKGSKEKTPPAIPQRNERRASVMMDNMLLELQNLDGTTSKDMETKSIMVEEDPHETYLSSEEDASLSDDYEESLLEVDMEDSNASGEGTPASRPASRRSQEDTATAVSFRIAGKPQIVEIYIHSPIERKRHTVNLDFDSIASTDLKSSKLKSRRPSPLKLFPPEQNRRASIASPTMTPSHSTSYISPSVSSYNSPRPTSSSSNTAPPRKSSRLASLKSNLSYHNTLMNNAGSVLSSSPQSFSALPTPQSSQAQHSFLNMDPFEAAHYHSPTEEHTPVPKTPTGMTSAAWKNVLTKGSLGRTLSKARKPSMPKLNMAYNTGRKESNASASTTNLSIKSGTSASTAEEHNNSNFSMQRRSATMPMGMQNYGEQMRPSTSSTTSSSHRGRFEDLVRRAPPPPPEPKQKQSSFARMGLGRKKSIKA